MQVVHVNDKDVHLSESGWLQDLGDWSEEVAVEIAAKAGVTLTDEHWDLIRVAREYYEEFGTCPQPRAYGKIMRKRFGPERSEQDYIYSLFPKGGLIKCINKIAGLPCPSECK